MVLQIWLALPRKRGGGLLLVLGEGPGLVRQCGEGYALARRGPDEAGVGGDGHDAQGVPRGEDGQGPALYLSWKRKWKKEVLFCTNSLEENNFCKNNTEE